MTTSRDVVWEQHSSGRPAIRLSRSISLTHSANRSDTSVGRFAAFWGIDCCAGVIVRGVYAFDVDSLPEAHCIGGQCADDFLGIVQLIVHCHFTSTVARSRKYVSAPNIVRSLPDALGRAYRQITQNRYRKVCSETVPVLFGREVEENATFIKKKRFRNKDRSSSVLKRTKISKV